MWMNKINEMRTDLSSSCAFFKTNSFITQKIKQMTIIII
ncbi:hypothetical protein [Escherichia coli IS35]|nr:hypothetical protein AC64_4912 [Escherichia coli 6-537-08_S3_C3]CDL02644.1 hypothetical protein [Escherichia coli IS35]